MPICRHFRQYFEDCVTSCDRGAPARCLRDIKTILDEIKTHKPENKKAPNLTLCFKNLLEEMVGVTGIEPVTPSMSTKCSPAELHPHTISYGQPIKPA